MGLQSRVCSGPNMFCPNPIAPCGPPTFLEWWTKVENGKVTMTTIITINCPLYIRPLPHGWQPGRPCRLGLHLGGHVPRQEESGSPTTRTAKGNGGEAAWQLPGMSGEVAQQVPTQSCSDLPFFRSSKTPAALQRAWFFSAIELLLLSRELISHLLHS